MFHTNAKKLILGSHTTRKNIGKAMPKYTRNIIYGNEKDCHKSIGRALLNEKVNKKWIKLMHFVYVIEGSQSLLDHLC